MNKVLYTLLCFILCLSVQDLSAGNPDRQGESGAAELLLNPWAKGAGLHSMTTSSVTGVGAMRINIAGLSRINKSEFAIANTRLYEGSDIGINALGFATKVGASGAFGISLMAMDFGDNIVTTTNQPEGTGGTYSPGFVNIGFGYSYTYANKISVGVLFRGISESVQGVSSLGFALDAGVQYVSGPKDNFKLGISLRNTGSPMAYGGDGLSQNLPDPDGGGYNLTYETRSEDFELPSVLNIGVSYDYYINDIAYVRTLGNFTSNAFGSDQLGGGVELSFKELVQLRAGYKYELDKDSERESIYTGLAMGATVLVPIKRGGSTKMAVDYAYRTTSVFKGTHNITLRLAI